MSGELNTFLRQINSGATTFTPEMWNYYKGDDQLALLKKYDPNAHFVEEDIGGGEGGSQGRGRRLVVDYTKLPKTKAGTIGLDAQPSNNHALYDPSKVIEDENYGSVTNSKNFLPEKKTALEIVGPLFVSIVAPMAGAALAAGGIGVGASAAASLGAGAAAEVGSGAAGAANWAGAVGGAAGGTASVTGSGLTGANTASLPNWATQTIARAPQTARAAANGQLTPSTFVPAISGALGVDPSLVNGGVSLTNLARSYARKP